MASPNAFCDGNEKSERDRVKWSTIHIEQGDVEIMRAFI